MLDIPVLTILGRGSSLARAMTESLHDWQAVATHAPRIITVAQSINARHFGLGELCDVLFDDGAPCTSCHRQGFYIYLITCKRVCYKCFTTKEQYNPVALPTAIKDHNLAPHELKKVPRIIGVLGQYGTTAYLLMKRQTLFDRQAVSALRPSSRTAAPGAPSDPRGPGSTFELASHCMVTASAPSLTVLPGGAIDYDWGVYCHRCIDDDDTHGEGWTRHTRAGFVQHMSREGLQHGREPISLRERDTSDLPYGSEAETVYELWNRHLRNWLRDLRIEF